MKIVYNLMTEVEVESVYNISKASFSVPWSKEAINAELNNPVAKYIVVKDEDSNLVIGFVGVWIIVGEAEITNIAIHPNYRKLGIGGGLLSALIKLCKDSKCSLINLEVRESNIPAQKLYKKFGFIVNGTRKGYYLDTGENAILMQLLI
ncbi:MAG: ribosomal protein S18-alanine N-acetyltransferase [Clostridium sp.]|nr:ribosomal protein S18-alanine N-acetyltransferase [Clostridium sp.]